MEAKPNLTSHCLKTLLVFLLFITISKAQTVDVKIVGSSTSIVSGSAVNISAGTSLNFRITNSAASCNDLEIQSVTISNTPTFSITPSTTTGNIRPASCAEWWWGLFGIKSNLDFRVQNNSTNCTSVSSIITIKARNRPDFVFTLNVNSSPKINVLGGSPAADITHNTTTTTDVNGTYFGVVEEGATITRNFVVANTGSCPLVISGITASASGFSLDATMFSPTNVPRSYPVSIAPGTSALFRVIFKGPVDGSGLLKSTISILNTDNTSFKFDVSAQMFNEDIPGPGGITTDFKLWLKATRGITSTGTPQKVSSWADLGPGPKNAIQPTAANQPTYLDNAASNINFNPVVDFKNGGGTEQFMYNVETPISGYYSADIFIVMVPDATITSASPKNTIIAGIESETVGDVTGVGFGNYSTFYTNEVLSYNKGIPGSATFNAAAEISTSKSYAGVGIINVTNNTVSSPTAQEILYNSNLLTTNKTVNTFANIVGSKYWIGKNYGQTANLNGRVAEIFTFGTKLDAASRQKVESYLAIKYGITLGGPMLAGKNYVNSFVSNNIVWNFTANSDFNGDVAGIGRDDKSDLNQKQSRTANRTDAVTIGLGGIFATNSANPNQFIADGDFLVWGNNQGNFSGTVTNNIAIGASSPTTVTRIDRKWKIVETIQPGSGDVDRVFVSIPVSSFSGFTKTSDEEYVLIVSDDAAFADANIIDVIPITADGSGNLQTWYDFDGIKFFTFGKASKIIENNAVSIESGHYLLGENTINLNVTDFTISAWVKADASLSGYRNVMSKGEKLQMRLNNLQQVEILIDDPLPKFTSTMALTDNKWHQITFVYDNGTVFLYIDGVLDKSAINVVAPSPNFNNYCIGALYRGKNLISNYFLGDIDEVYIWDQKLTELQVRYLMNQQADNISNNVTGQTIPYAASSNVVSSIPWGNLKVYYDFNSFYGSTVEGQANIKYFMRMNYFNKNKAIVSTQTAPLPYVSATSGAWDTPATWLNSADQVLPNTLSLNGTTTIDWNIAEIGHNITSGNRDITLLGLVQKKAGKLTIAASGPQDETNSGRGLLISHYLELDGVIDLVGESQLLQSEGSIIDADSGGYIERDQQGTANGFNYNYWSSSVGPEGNENTTLGSGVTATIGTSTIFEVLKDGTSSASYQNITFDPSSAAANSNTPTTPITISSRWLYTFYGTEDDYDVWKRINENTPLLSGEGFVMKGSSGATPISTNQNYVFKGLPNNGDFTLSLVKNTGDVERLIGNPYPSAMDANQFILDNLSTAEGGNNTENIFNGALYFWDHFGEQNSHILKEYVGGYATYNLTGGAVAISNDIRINNTSNGGNPAIGVKLPGQYIPVNQGFFVSTKFDLAIPNNNSGTITTTVNGGNIVFKNSQRAYRKEGVGSTFLKSSNIKKSSSSAKTRKPNIKLMYDSPLGYHRQIVLGTNTNASEDFDLGYDALMIDVNEEDFYWMLNENELVIQGVDGFNEAQEFSIGLKVKKSGLAKIRMEPLGNLEDDMNLFIKDNLTGEYHKINNEPFEMYLDAGIYNDRFVLVFSSESTLTIEENELLNEIMVFYDSETDSINIKTRNETSNILSVKIYNLAGQTIKSLTTNIKEINIPMSVSSGIYIVKCHTENGTTNKKIIIN